MKFFSSLFVILFSTALYAQDDRESFIEKLARYKDVIESVAQGSLDSRGLSWDNLFRPNVPSYESVHENINDRLKNSSCLDLCADPAADLALLADTEVAPAQEIRVLLNEDSFALRRELMRKAQKNIWIMSWAIYDDDTGLELQEELLSALERNPELDIRIIVDGNIANLNGRKVLRRLDRRSQGKIRIMKWKSKKYRASGNHRKIFLVDDEHFIIGGMNIGNMYSHIKVQGKDKWRDLDIYVRGKSSGIHARNKFAKVWNLHLAEFKNRVKTYGLMDYASPIEEESGIPLFLVDQHPGSKGMPSYHNVHTAIVHLFRQAKNTVDIENAYFIMDPIIRGELRALLARGVKVRLFTNSDKSLDEKIVSTPVMASARDMAAMGAKVYLRREATLHSKYFVVDGKVSVVGSFNFHPRSLRFDAETVAVVFNEKLARELTAVFESGIAEADFYQDPEQIKIDFNLLSLLTKKFYFDFL